MKNILKRFAADKRGSAYAITGIAALPIFGMVALGVDYSNFTRIEKNVETAAQATALHVAKRLALDPSLTSDELVAEGKLLMTEMLNGTEVEYDRFDVETNSGLVRIETRLEFDTYFMTVFGYDTITSLTKTQSQFGRRNVEVALAMDNSGSMGSMAGSSIKLDASKEAAKVLINTASAAVEDFENADLRFSLIPWHTNVSVPEEHRTDSSGNDLWWIDWEGRSTGHFNYLAPYLADGSGAHGDMYWAMGPGDPSEGDEWRYYDPSRLIDFLPLEPDGDGVDIDALRNMPNIGIVTRKDVYDRFTNVEWNGCFEHRHGDYRFSFDPPNQGDGDSLFVPHMAPDERDYWGSRNSYINDLGGVSDNDGEFSEGNNAQKERARVFNTAKYVGAPGPMTAAYDSGNWVEGPNGKCNTAPLIPLTGDKDDIFDTIDGMMANGNTDLTIGLEWAMHTLTPWEPFEEAKSFAESQKILVFMTDGDNYPRRPGHYRTSYSSFQYPKDDLLDIGLPASPSQAQGVKMFDDAAKQYCTEIKNRGVKIYFVYFGSPSTNAREVMEHCASNPDTAIEASNDEELIDAFEKIGDEIGRLRLTHYTPPAE